MSTFVPEDLINLYCPESLNMISDARICASSNSKNNCRKCWETAVEFNEKLVKGYKFALELEDDFFATISRRKSV